jgi:hypothetical protein
VPPYASAPSQGYPAGAGTPYGTDPYGTAPYGGAPYAGAPGPRPAGKGLAITALVLGVVGFLGALIPFGILGAGLLLLAAIVIGIIVLVRKNPGKGMAIAGVVLGGLGLIVGIVSTIAALSLVTTQFPGIIQEECQSQGYTPQECAELFEN